MSEQPDLDPRPETELVTTDRAGAQRQRCPLCNTPRNGTDRFCEVDGHDFDDSRGWAAVVSADREYHEQVAAESIPFPPAYASRTFALDADEISIGRSSESRGIHPDIDLAGTSEDPGISHFHALLVRSADGSFAIVDAGSTNGTTLNDDATLLAPDVSIPLADGDRVHLGAWTTITIQHRGSNVVE